MYSENFNNLTFFNLYLRDNYVINRGGGIYLNNYNFFNMTNSTLIKNNAINSRGGGLYFYSFN
jgi:hypothetical protein